MKIAVLMSTYNGEKYLDEQLKSLAKQTVADKMTLYIRDDGSTDCTLDIIDQWRSKINIVLYKGINSGPAMSFWKLLMNQEIQADYYAFCDQDDIWDNDKLEQGILKLTNEYHLYACNCRIIDENGNVAKAKRVSGIPNMDTKRLFVSGFTQGCSMIFTDDLCQYIRKKKINCIPMHDVVLMLYAEYFGKIYWDTEPHFGYRVHSNNVVAKSNKSLIKKIRTTWWNWNNSKNNSMTIVAKEMLENIERLPNDDSIFIEQISEYRKHRLQVITYYKKYKLDTKSKRSFNIRILMGLY